MTEVQHARDAERVAGDQVEALQDQVEALEAELQSTQRSSNDMFRTPVRGGGGGGGRGDDDGHGGRQRASDGYEEYVEGVGVSLLCVGCSPTSLCCAGRCAG